VKCSQLIGPVRSIEVSSEAGAAIIFEFRTTRTAKSSKGDLLNPTHALCVSGFH
jgi:hypothetical protein